MDNLTYIIIGGISKAGTTSLFDYLAAHPEVEGSSIKQSLFFLDKNLQKQFNKRPMYDYEKGLDQFEKYFLKSEKQTKYRVEATPDYLYSLGSAKRIANFFKTHPGKILMILRNPVSRFNSFYYFGKQQGLIPEDMTYKQFYEASKKYNENRNQCLMAYETGFYAKYLEEYKFVFGENLKVIFFEDLKNNPKNLLQRLCNILNIDSEFYETYLFSVKNETVQIKNHGLRNFYTNLRQFYIDHFYQSSAGVQLAKILKSTITPLYRKLNYQPLYKNKTNEEVNNCLRVDYEEDIKKLKYMIEKEIPW